MSTVQALKHRPWIVTAAAAAVLAIVMLVIPVSYSRTTGHDVSLTLANVGDPAGIRAIAQELKTAVGGGQVAVKASDENGATVFTFETFVPSSVANAPAIARAFARQLSERGFTATAEAKPHVEQVSGSVYAFARERVIQVNTDGKSAAQIEAEIRARLAEAGITNTQVSVTDENGMRKVQVQAQKILGPGETGGEPEPFELQLTKNGQPLQSGGVSVEIMRKKTPAGMSLQLEVSDRGKTAHVEVANADTKSDAAIAAEIEAQLRQAGLDLPVKVTGGTVEIGDLESRRGR